MKIWLADLTYTQQSIASDVVPAGIGMIAEYAEKKIPNFSLNPIINYFIFGSYLKKFLEELRGAQKCTGPEPKISARHSPKFS